MTSLNLEFEVVKKKTWDNIVLGLDNSTIFHTWEWIKILEKHAPKKLGRGTELLPLIGENDKSLIAVPLFVYDRLGLKLIYSPPPKTLTLYLGMIVNGRNEKNKIEALLQFLRYISNEFEPSYVRMTLHPGFLDYRPFHWINYSVNLYSTYTIELNTNLWRDLPRRVREGISSAKKRYEIRDGKRSDLAEVIKLLKNRNHLNGSEDIVFEVFEKIDNKFIVAEKDGIFLSGTIFLSYKNEVIAWIGNATPKIKAPFVNELILWKGIEWAMENGCQKFEMLGAHERSLFPFKAKFNPTFTLISSTSRVRFLQTFIAPVG